MPSYGKSSTRHLSTCDYRLQDLFNEVIRHVDCSILCGFRCEAEQHAAYDDGKSEVDWPHSKHNTNPSKAVDVIPYPVDWDDIERLICFGKLVKEIAKQKKIKIKWGGDFKSFFDAPHFEVIDE